MKKRFLTFILTIMAMLTCVFGLFACNTVEFKVNFVVDGEVYSTINTNGEEVIKMPENPTKEGYTFDGWFWDKDVWEKPFTANSLLDAPLSSDMSVYAKFSLIHNCDFKEKVASDIYKATGATCENKATYYFSCSCGEMGTETFESGVAQGHSFTNYISDNNATCEVDGTKTAKCENCEETDTITDVNSKLGHSFTNYISDNNATCEVDGTKTAICNRNGCNETDTITDVGSKLGHSFTNYISDNNATYEVDGTKTAVCNRNDCNETDTITDNGSKLQSYFGFNLGYTINNRKAYIKVCSTTKTIYFPDEIVLKGNATYKVYKDIGCENELKGKELVLENVGENKCYILATVNGEDTLYHVTIYLRTKFTVDFITNNNTTIESQVIEEDSLAQKPNDLVKAGYTFNGYDFDFNTPITKNETVTALWTANDNTPYTVEYYLENIENEEYTLTQTNNLTGVTDTTAYAEIKTFEHFTAEKQTVSGNINGDGTTVLKVYYQRNEYTVSNADKSLGSITGAGKYKYGKQVTLTATPNLGYDFIGWYNGNTLLNSNLEYKFTIDKDIIAKFTIKPEMANFNFTSTATTCVISGVKNKTITEITVPNYVTSIGSSAFAYCTSLTSVYYNGTIDEWVQIELNNYDSNPLYYAKNLYINNELVTEANIITATKINAYAFYNCTSLTSVVIGDSVTSIGDWAFYDCDSLTSVEIPNSVTSIGYEAFAYCNSLTSVYYKGTIDEWVQIEFNNYYSNPLYYAKNLYTNNQLVTEANIITATKINAYAFYNCTSLTSVVIGDSVTSIGYTAFDGCNNLTSVTIGNSVESIGNSAFSNCYSLVEVINKSSHITVTKSTNNGYLGYHALAIYNSGDTFTGTKLSNDNGYIVYTEGSEKILVAYNGNQTNLTITNYITKINDYAFYNCDSLTSIEIPNSVTSIGDSAFEDCSSLTSIEIPNSVTSIGDSAFSRCFSLTSIEIPNSVKSIGKEAFAYCFSLTIYCEATSKPSNWSSSWNSSNYPVVWNCNNNEVAEDGYIYTVVDGIRYGLKDGVANIVRQSRNITIASIPIKVTYKGTNYTVTSICDYAFRSCHSLTSVIIPNSVTSIGNEAFAECYKLTSLVIPNSVTSIGYRAFYHCDSLTSIEIPDSVTSIGYRAFYHCDSLTSIEIPNSVTSIGSLAFYSCDSLRSVVIGDSVTSIGEEAFSGCTSLTSIMVDENNENYKSIDGNLYSKDGKTLIQYAIGKTDIAFTIPNSVTSIGYRAFYHCNSLTSIEIPSSVTSISNEAFYNCDSLTIVTIGNSVTSIGNEAFYDCDSLTSIEIPNSVTSIGYRAFDSCSKLTSLIFRDTSTWYRTTSISDWNNKTYGTSTVVTSSSSNATYFKSTYYDYYWYKL